MKNGDRTPVLEINKLRYLNLLAEYRLSTRVKDKIEHFTKGDSLLMFVRVFL